MLWYYLIFLVVVFCFYHIQAETDLVRRKAKQFQMLVFVLFFLALFVGLSDMFGGYDRYIYGSLFDDAADVITLGQSYDEITLFQQYPKEQGYDWFNVIIGLLTENRYVFIFITIIIIYVFLFFSIKEYCSNYPFALILFLALWFFFTFTYLRECLGVTVAWLSIRYIKKRSFLKFLIVWFIAFKFHNSALVFFPMYFVPTKKFKIKFIISGMVFLFFLGVVGLGTAVFNAYGEIDSNRINDINNETGFRIAYFIEAIFFLWLILSKYDEIPNVPTYNIMLNMSLVFCALLLFFIKSENGGRLSWYYMMGIISIISYLATSRSSNQSIANMMIFICFFLFSRIVLDWGIQLYPYKTFFTNGIRKGDFIEVEYEYDHRYDADKFYRPAFRFIKE